MKSQIVPACVLGLWLGLPAVAHSQDFPVAPGRISADTNNAVIEGRVTLPSGFSADRNVRIILKNSQSNLFTIYSNKHGEFRFHDLSEGTYYVQAESIGPEFAPVVEKVQLGRGIVYQLTLQLREGNPERTSSSGARIVSAAELRQVVPPAARKAYAAAVKFVEKGNPLQAAVHFGQALEIYPEYLAARNDLGAQYLKLKRIDEAEEHFRTVLDADPKNSYARFNLGLVRIERRQYGEAIIELNRSLALDTGRPSAHLWLGFALLEMGDLAAAERELVKSLIKGGTECAAAHYHLGRAYIRRGDPTEAMRALRAYLDESPRGEHAQDSKQLLKSIEAELKNQPRQ